MIPTELKALLASYRTATADFDTSTVRAALAELFVPEATMHLCHPFGTLKGADAFLDVCLSPLYAAFPDLERRDKILLAGTTPEGQDWIGAMGNYIGTFLSPFLDIPPTGHLREFNKARNIGVTQYPHGLTW